MLKLLGFETSPNWNVHITLVITFAVVWYFIATRERYKLLWLQGCRKHSFLGLELYFFFEEIFFMRPDIMDVWIFFFSNRSEIKSLFKLRIFRGDLSN